MELLNWPPSRGPDPNRVRRTYIPKTKKLYEFSRLPDQDADSFRTGSWLGTYRVSLIRSLSMEQADFLVNITPLSPDNRGYDLSFYKRVPVLYVDFKEIPVRGEMVKLKNPYRLKIEGCELVLRYPDVPGHRQREQETLLLMTSGILLHLVSKELKRIYAKEGYEDSFPHVYYDQIDLHPSGLISIRYLWYESPTEIVSATADIKTENIEPVPGIEDDDMIEIVHQKSMLSGPDLKKVRNCGIVGRWLFGTHYPIEIVATLSLQQAHELLHASKEKAKTVTKGPKFEELQEQSLAFQEEVLTWTSDPDEDGDPDYDFESDEDEIQELAEQAHFCPNCGSDEYHYDEHPYEGEFYDVFEPGEIIMWAGCPECGHEWYQPLIESYTYYKTVKMFDRWAECRGQDAPTLIIPITSYINKTILVTIPPVTVSTDIGQFRMTSLGYVLWVLTKQYLNIWQNHEEHGVWGHGLGDLVFEGFNIDDDGSINLLTGS